jgi:hypothetical protein
MDTKGDTGDVLVKPFSRVDLVSLNRSSIRIDAGELHIFAEIVFTIQTKEAFAAWNTRLNSYSIT